MTDASRVLSQEVAGHPASRAWLQLRRGNSTPTAIEVLKERKKSAAYRLHGVGGDGSIVAKRSPADQHELECALYMRVLPALRLRTPRCDGSVESEGSHWLFLEDVGEHWYDPGSPVDRRLAAEWLAQLHSAPCELGHDLPSRGADYYLEMLRETRTGLQPALRHPAVEHGDRRVLERILRHLDRLEPAWPELVETSSLLPEGLVHGDFVPKNVRLVQNGQPLSIVVFDWGTAGWGAPAADLSQFARRETEDSLIHYLTALGPGARIPLGDARRAAAAGVVFRIVKAVQWESRSFAHDWIERAKQKMVVYEGWLAEAQRAARWAA